MLRLRMFISLIAVFVSALNFIDICPTVRKIPDCYHATISTDCSAKKESLPTRWHSTRLEIGSENQQLYNRRNGRGPKSRRVIIMSHWKRQSRICRVETAREQTATLRRNRQQQAKNSIYIILPRLSEASQLPLYHDSGVVVVNTWLNYYKRKRLNSTLRPFCWFLVTFWIIKIIVFVKQYYL
uniref:G_PROTEIN_RECEP_F1_2 domain-containing protein n=1 Tax=Panagrellus redivivus TaxID=6233 RepID=A0A7E4W9A9_PANRE